MSVILDALRRARHGVPPPEPPQPPDQKPPGLLALLCLVGLVVVLISVGAAMLFPAWQELMFWIATAGVLIPLSVALGFVAKAIREKRQKEREDRRRLLEIRRLNEEYLREERHRAEEYAARNAQPESHRRPDWTDEPLRQEPSQDRDQEPQHPPTFEWKMPLFILGCAVLGSFLAWHTISLLKSIEWGGVLRVALWLIAIAAIGWMVYKAASTKNWKWAAGAAAVLIAAVAVHNSWLETKETTVEVAVEALTSTPTPTETPEPVETAAPPAITRVVVGPSKPFSIRIEPGYGLNFWPKSFTPAVRRKGLDFEATFSSATETELGYELYLCTREKPCGEAPTEEELVSPEPAPEPTTPKAPETTRSRAPYSYLPNLREF